MTPPPTVLFVSRYVFGLYSKDAGRVSSSSLWKIKSEAKVSADAEFLFDFSEFVEVLALQVFKQPLAITHHFE